MSILTRTTVGLYYKTDFSSPSGWSLAASPFTFDQSLPTYQQFDPTPYTIAAIPATFDAAGIRELTLFVDNDGPGTWWLNYGSYTSGNPWRDILGSYTDRGITLTRTGALDIALQKAGGGSWSAADHLTMHKSGSTYYMHTLGAGANTGGVPGEPYSGQVSTIATMGQNGWALQNITSSPGMIGSVDAEDNVLSCVIKIGSTYHFYTSIVNTPGGIYGIAHFTSASPLLTSPTYIGTAIIAGSSAYSYENFKAFYSAALAAYVAFSVKFFSGTNFNNVTLTSPDATAWSPGPASDLITMQPCLLTGGVTAVNILAPVVVPEFGVAIDANGYLPCTYDFYPSTPYINTAHKGGFVISEPALYALNCNGQTILINDLFPVPPYTVGNLDTQNNWSQVLGATKIQVVSNGNVNLGTNPEDDIIVNTGFSVADATATMAVTFPSTTVSAGIIGRYVSSTDFLLFDFAVTGGNNLQITIYYKNGGGYQLLYNSGAIGGTTGSGAHTFIVNAIGNVYKLYIDGVLKETYTDGTSGYTAAGEWGMRNGGGGTGARTVNSFEVTKVATAVTSRTLSHTDFYAEFGLEFKLGSAAGIMGFDFLRQDASNYYRLEVTLGGATVISKYVAGVRTQLAASGGSQVTAAGTISYLRISSVSNLMVVTMDGEGQISYTDIVAPYTSGASIAFYDDGNAAYRVRAFHMRKGNTVVVNSLTNGHSIVLRAPGLSPANLPIDVQTVSSGSVTHTYAHYPQAVENDATAAIDYTPYNGDQYIWGGDVFALGAALAAGSISETAHTTTTLSFTATNSTGGVTPYAYQWAYRVHNTGGYVNTGTNSLSLAQTGLTPSTAYDFRLTYTDAGSGNVQAFLLNISTDGASAPPSGNALLGGMVDMTGGMNG